MVKIYKQPFAHEGDTIAIPDTSQPNGKMSSADGWTPDYQLPKTDPNYKPVGRQEMNGVFKEVTEALGQVQVQGSATWSPDGAPYPINAQVYHNGKQWLALRANSVVPAEGADWSAIGTAATHDVGESAGQVMQVGARNWGSMSTPSNGLDLNDFTNVSLYPASGASYLYSTDNTGGPTSNGTHVLTMKYTDDYQSQLGIQHNGRAYVRAVSGGDLRPWSELIRSESLLQTTGSSTEFPMSQDAVRNAINNSSIGVGQTWQNVTTSRAAGTTYTNTTGRPIEVAITSRLASGTGGAGHSFVVNGVEVGRANNRSSEAEKSSFTSVVVPAGATYSAAIIEGSLYRWTELR